MRTNMCNPTYSGRRKCRQINKYTYNLFNVQCVLMRGIRYRRVCNEQQKLSHASRLQQHWRKFHMHVPTRIHRRWI